MGRQRCRRRADTRAGAASTIGTSFGPAQPTAVAALERHVGVSRSNVSARFLWFQDTSPGGAPSTTFRERPVWVTEGVAVGPRGESFAYQFEYEPFNGRLVGVVRR